LTHPTSDSYRLLDAGRGERLEQWGPYRLRRPDPRATMGRALPAEQWSQIDAHYRGEAGQGRWEHTREFPDRWTITHGGITLVVKLAPFKHTGVFPEQADHWRWMTSVAADASAASSADAPATSPAARAARPLAGRPLDVLNLFAYTGGATMALACAGHHVTHVDASKPALTWARENAAANHLAPDAIRWIQDDALTFARREHRRGKQYDAAILDPPAFGRTPDGRVWRLRDQIPELLDTVAALLTQPVFVLINDYSRDADQHTLATLVESALHSRATPGHIEAGRLELPLPARRILDTGAYVRWRAERA
jgi:23S rRNA (cytosine1962-C5)-methyltransferase